MSGCMPIRQVKKYTEILEMKGLAEYGDLQQMQQHIMVHIKEAHPEVIPLYLGTNLLNGKENI